MSGDKTGKERNLERLREESNLTYVRIQELYLAGRISKKEYEAYRRELFGGKTPLDYYSGLNEVLTRRRQVIRPVSRAPYVFLALFLILASFTVVFFQGGITGLVIGEQSRNYTLTYNTTFNSTTRMLFTASDILSLSASGTIEGDGHVAIYARTKDGALLIFERPALHSEDVEMNTTDKDVRVDNVTVDNVSDGNVGDQEVVDGNTADDNVSDDNVTADTVRDDVIDGNVVDQDVRVQDVTDGNVVDQAEETTTQYAFTSVCEETCLLPGITTTEIEVVLDGARLTLDSLSYTKRSRNSAPVQMKNISSFWMVDNVTLDSLRYFSDIDEDNLTFKIRPNPYVRLEQQGHDLFLYSTGIAGEYELFLTVSDGFEEVESNTFGVRVLIAEPLRRSMQENQSSPFVGVPVVWEKQLAYENLLNESLTESVSFTLPALIKNFTLVDEQTGKSIPADTLVSVQEGDAVTYSFSSDFLPEETQAYRVNYTTPAPEQREEALTPSKKRVVISADYPYENVTVRTQITPAPESAIRLYWIVDGEKQAFPINRYIDSDEDGNVDVIEWIVPHLSEQEFEVEIVILNVQSYPTVGGNWTVLFNTTGMADLTIAAVNGTTYNTSPNDLTPLELSCGGEVRSFSWTGNESVAYEDWECEGTGTWGVLVNTGGSHHQAFTFGNQTEYAHNYAGCGAAWCMDVNLGGTGDNHSNASFWGIEGSVEGEGGDISGSALTSVGDVNGDGYDDFVIGASGRNPGTGLDTGESYLVFGRASGWAMDTSVTSSNASFWGETGSDYAGYSVSGVGDVNGDGYDDFVIGANGRNPGPATRAGESYLVLGRASGWAMNTWLGNCAGGSDNCSNASFWGETASGYAGTSVSGVGDVNGDGYDDFVIGANHRNPGPGVNTGESYLVLGRASGWVMDVNLSGVGDNRSNASFWGEASGDSAGFSVSGVGDVNGDGYDDFVIGAPYRNLGPVASAGESYLVLGRASGWVMDVNLSGPGDNRSNASFWGEAKSDNAGRSVSGVGDVNGDGYDDFVIGAAADPNGAAGAGESYLILGRASGWVMDVNLSGPGDNRSNASFWGEAKSDNAGRSVSGVGDVNGDGYDDFLIGAYARKIGSAIFTGESYLVLGRASGWSLDVNLSGVGDNRSNASFWGEVAVDQAGTAVSGAGDVNGDGYDDFLIGAPIRDPGIGADSIGESYLILGQNSSFTPKTVSSITIYKDSAYSKSASGTNAYLSSSPQKLYIEVQATGKSSSVAEVAVVLVNSTSNGRTIKIKAIETGVNTNVFRAGFLVRTGASNREYIKIGAANESTLFVKSWDDQTKSSSTTILYGVTDQCDPSGAWTISSSLSCQGTRITASSLTINAGGILLLNDTSLNVSGDTIIASGGGLDVLNSKGSIWFSDNVTISGYANFSNATVHMNGSCDGCVALNVTSTGVLVINASTNLTAGVDSTKNYYFEVQKGGNLTILDSNVEFVGWMDAGSADARSGMTLRNNGSVIRNSTFFNNFYDILIRGNSSV
ncbi:MAG: integrin alpha, partial [Nanoarchaeota archaeon]